MPYKNIKMKIPHELDRRVRVTEDMAQAMREMYGNGNSLHAIANTFHVDRKTVKRHVIPSYLEEMREKSKQDKPWLMYYDRDKHREQVKLHRHYKRELELSGKLSAG